ncbi:hypothetical protein OCU04_008573 [Sclerotinia nivalis]|uniref:Uncharacterized protein n=1 Tax=Sclerotinia nivalis TaxID=352851 RepID=A0A9X0DI73_9HELO|nr:hypothetical protein OCU04_008573 [Sclerotinia nivalis]
MAMERKIESRNMVEEFLIRRPSFPWIARTGVKKRLVLLLGFISQISSNPISFMLNKANISYVWHVQAVECASLRETSRQIFNETCKKGRKKQGKERKFHLPCHAYSLFKSFTFHAYPNKPLFPHTETQLQ